MINFKPRQVYLLQQSYSKAPVELELKFIKLYTRQNLHTKTQLLQGSSGARAKIWSNYTQVKAYILQHSYSQTSVEQEPKFGQITQVKAYILQHNYSKAPVELELKFGQIIHKSKPTYYNTATPRLQRS